MAILSYFKAEPTDFARVTVSGKVYKQGKGISCFYVPFLSTIEMATMATQDQPFSFKEISKENQQVNLQGGFLYEITDASQVFSRYNFSVDSRTKTPLTDDPTKLADNLLQDVRGETRKIVQSTPLERLLLMADELSEKVSGVITARNAVDGVRFKRLYFEAITPNPEISKALEANYREALMQKADEAIYARRATAVEQERAIKENEMKTAVELEEKRKELVELEGKNTLQRAEYLARATTQEFSAYEKISPEKLTAMALLKLGQNAGKIGNLTITPDILAGMLHKG